MIDLENYRRSISRLGRTLERLRCDPDIVAHLSLLHAFEVNYNLTEATLRIACAELKIATLAECPSVRELIRRADEDGLAVPAISWWLEYGIKLETASQFYRSTATVVLDSQTLTAIERFTADLSTLATSLQRRLVSHA